MNDHRGYLICTRFIVDHTGGLPVSRQKRTATAAFLLLVSFLPGMCLSQTKPDSTAAALIIVRDGKIIPLQQAGVGRSVAQTPAGLAEVQQQVLEQLRQQQFYFAGIDSFIARRKPGAKSASLHLYLSSGPRFELAAQLHAADSLRLAPDWLPELRGRRSEVDWLQRLQNLLADLARHGHPLASLRLDSVTVTASNRQNQRLALLHFRLDPGPAVRIDSIAVHGNKVTRPNVLLRELPIQPGEEFNLEKVENIPGRLLRLGFLKAVAPPQLHRTGTGRYVLDLNVTEGNSNFLNGVAGYNPGSGGNKGFLTGLIDLKFGNLLGTGRLVNVRWEKRSRETQELGLRYREPWVAGWPLHLAGGFQQLIQDTLYVERRWELTAEIPAGGRLTLIGQLLRATVSPDSLAALQLGLPESGVASVAAGLRYDSRDDLINPRSGVYYATSLETGRKRVKMNTGDQSFFHKKLNLDFAWLLPLGRSHVLSLALHGRQITTGEAYPAITDQIRFGGATTLRGYREEQFRGSRVAWSNLEYRYLLSRQSRAFVFWDLGYFFREDPVAGAAPEPATSEAFKRSYGVGARLDTPLGIVGLDYGLGEGDDLLNGKVHVSLLNSF